MTACAKVQVKKVNFDRCFLLEVCECVLFGTKVLAGKPIVPKTIWCKGFVKITQLQAYSLNVWKNHLLNHLRNFVLVIPFGNWLGDIGLCHPSSKNHREPESIVYTESQERDLRGTRGIDLEAWELECVIKDSMVFTENCVSAHPADSN